MSSSEFNHCAHCGAALAQESRGQCPACVFRWIMADPSTEASFPTPPGYELVTELGRGGSGTVWQARHLELNRAVALKVLNSGRFAGEVERGRLRREAQAMAQLNHPGIVKIHEVGEVEGYLFLAMELISGISLADRLRGGPLPYGAAAQMMQTVADAVSHAHGRGIIHRDLKPSNILLDAVGAPHISDFGIAKFILPDPAPPGGPLPRAASLPPTPFHLTMTGETLGTIHYLAPEQASGSPRDVGVSVDIHALGAVLYHCLTGRPPFLGDSFAETLRQVTDADPPPIRDLNMAVPRDLETICLKCLAKAPIQRYLTAAEVRDELARWVEGRPIHARPPSPIERFVRLALRHPTVSGLAATIVTVLVSATLLTSLQARKVSQANQALKVQTREQVARLTSTELERGETTRGMAHLAKQIRDDPTFRNPGRQLSIWLREGNWMVPRVVLGESPAGDDMVRLSHDHRRLLASRFSGGQKKRMLVIWDLGQAVGAHSQPKIIASWPSPIEELNFLGFAPDDQAIELQGTNQEVLAFRVDGSPLGRRPDWPLASDSDANPLRSPDGTRALRGNANWSSLGRLELVNTVANTVIQSFRGESAVPGGTWHVTPLGPVFLTSVGRSLRIRSPVDGSLVVPALNIGGIKEDACWSDDGRFLAVAAFDMPVVIYELLAPPAPPPHLQLPGAIRNLSWSDHGAWLAIAAETNTVAVWKSASASTSGTSVETNFSGTAATFIPRGLDLVSGTLTGDVFLREWNTPQPPVLLSRFPAPITHLAASADGAWVAAVASNRWIQVISLHSPNTTRPWVEIPFNGRNRPDNDKIFALAFTPDSRQVAVASYGYVAAVWSAADLQLHFTVPFSAPSTCIAFSPDSQWLAAGDMNGHVYLADARTGKLNGSELPHPDEVWDLHFSSDDHRLATVGSDGHLRRWRIPDHGLLVDEPISDQVARRVIHSWHDQLLIVGTSDGYLHRYDAEFGTPLAPPIHWDTGVVRQIAQNPDGRRFAIGTSSGAVRILDLGNDPTTPPDWVAPLAEAVGGERIVSGKAIERQRPEEFLRLRARLANLNEPDPDWDFIRRRFASGSISP